jgi:hypothetical protein
VVGPGLFESLSNKLFQQVLMDLKLTPDEGGMDFPMKVLSAADELKFNFHGLAL